MSEVSSKGGPHIDTRSQGLSGDVPVTVSGVADSASDSGIIRVSDQTRFGPSGLLRIGNNVYEVTLDTCKDVMQTMADVAATGGTRLHTITGDLVDFTFLVGPSSSIVVETGGGAL